MARALLCRGHHIGWQFGGQGERTKEVHGKCWEWEGEKKGSNLFTLPLQGRD